uniref:UDP-glycosyltransferases domain-containing protein n=1 Tax=Oryza barthii TaxID=65489 RepID=A0A0D3FR73_9ORYZ
MRTKTFVLFPSLGVGHLNPMVEMAKHLRRRGLAVVVAVIDPPDNDATSADATARLAAANPALAALLHLPYYYPDVPSFREMGMALVRLPGMPPLRAVDMVATVQDKESDATKVRLYQFKRMAEAKGVLVNSFDRLEPKALNALAAGVCVPDKPTPRVYCIGPLVDAGAGKNGERHPCLAWLDAQPRQSVVFLCFGSKGAFPAAQLKDIARGLESSGHRFLWAVRSPPEEQSTSPEPDLERLLPAGFLERTKHRGMVVKNWAPQAEVELDAGGDHVGAADDLLAAAMNRVLMVEEMKVAVALDGGEVGGALVAVAAEEVEAKVRLVMETEEGRKLRERVVETRDMALDAINRGGSSEIAFDEFMRDLEKMNSLENGGGRSC